MWRRARHKWPRICPVFLASFFPHPLLSSLFFPSVVSFPSAAQSFAFGSARRQVHLPICWFSRCSPMLSQHRVHVFPNSVHDSRAKAANFPAFFSQLCRTARRFPWKLPLRRAAKHGRSLPRRWRAPRGQRQLPPPVRLRLFPLSTLLCTRRRLLEFPRRILEVGISQCKFLRCRRRLPTKTDRAMGGRFCHAPWEKRP